MAAEKFSKILPSRRPRLPRTAPQKHGIANQWPTSLVWQTVLLPTQKHAPPRKARKNGCNILILCYTTSRQVSTPCPSAACGVRSALRRSLNKKWEAFTMKKMTVQHLTTAAVVGAAYAVLSLFGSVFGVTFGTVQCRFSEALCVLPFFFPETVWGLFAGCLITNLLSPYGLVDIVVGSLATLLAAFLTSKCGKKWLAPLPPVVCNGLLVGGMLAWEQVGFTGAFGVAFLANGASVAAGEALACYGLGALLLWRLPRMAFFKNRMRRE